LFISFGGIDIKFPATIIKYETYVLSVTTHIHCF